MRTWLIRFIKLVIFLGIMVSAITAFYAVTYFKEPGPLIAQQEMIIPSGTSLKQISVTLANAHVIEYPLLFEIIVRITKEAGQLKAGQYLFFPHMSPAEIYNKLVSGDVMVHQLTIPEGLMSFQIAQLVKDAPYLEGEVPADLKEGELLPETYHYYYGDKRAVIIDRMHKAMQEEVKRLWENRKPNPLIPTKEAFITLASLVEKETRIADERALIAGVFLNRLEKQMRLQTDPTVIYALTKGKYVLERPLLYKDLAMADPYNTYQNIGLPPTPITNPGTKSLEAVLNPAQTDALYFVADGTGGHQFSKTLGEHEAHVKNWRKVQKSQRAKEKELQTEIPETTKSDKSLPTAINSTNPSKVQ